MEEFLDIQKNINYLEHHPESRRNSNRNLFQKPAKASGEDLTSEGNTATLPLYEVPKSAMKD